VFSQIQRSNTRRIGSLAASSVVHCLVLYLLIRSPHARFLKPSALAWGSRGTSSQLVYVPRPGIESAAASKAAPERPLLAPARRSKRQKPEVSKTEPGESLSAESARAGSPLGSMAQGPLEGHDVRPALPLVFPDVSRSDIPPGVQGDVVVEITIDERGNVVATKVLQPLGHGLEERVVGVLHDWRFRPATMDGVAIPSQQDVHFHFPS